MLLAAALRSASAQTSSDYSLFDISGQTSGSSNDKFAGVSVVQGTTQPVAVFTPSSADCVGIYSTATGAFMCPSTITSGSDSVHTNNKFLGAAVSRGSSKVIMAPYRESRIGIFDVAAYEAAIQSGNTNGGFTPFTMTGVSWPSSDAKFAGAVSMNDGKVAFAPNRADCIGIFDPNAAGGGSFTCEPVGTIAGVSAVNHKKFHGAALARDGRVILAPHQANCVGIYNPNPATGSSPFSCEDISSVTSISGKFQGAVTAPDGKIIFAPYQADCVGVFDPAATSSPFACISSSPTTANAKFLGGVVGRNGLAIFAPFSVDVIGMFDAASSTYTAISIPSSLWSTQMAFSGAATTDTGLVLFAPRKSNGIGLFQLPPPPPAPPHPPQLMPAPSQSPFDWHAQCCGSTQGRGRMLEEVEVTPWAGFRASIDAHNRKLFAERPDLASRHEAARQRLSGAS